MDSDANVFAYSNFSSAEKKTIISGDAEKF